MKKNIYLALLIIILTQISQAATLTDIKSKWLTVDNKEQSVSSTAGQSYTLIAMVYTGCAHACPMTISKIQRILKDFEGQGFKNVNVILASFDVKNDRPAKLKKYQLERKLDVKKWSFLSAASDDDARELSVALGISYKDLGDGDFSHSNAITLLGPGAEILASIDNLNASSDKLIEALKAHTAKAKAP